MPHLVRWHEELSLFGLVVVAPQVQNAAPEKVKEKARSLGISFAVTAGGGIVGGKGGGIPHSYLFDHEGKCLFDGPPNQVEAQMRIAVGKALVERTGKASLSKSVQSLADSLKNGTAPALVLQKAVPLQKNNEDAKALIEVLTATGKKQFEEATSKVDEDPVAAYFQAARLNTVFKGTPVGSQAGELLGKLKSDKNVTLELKARPSLDQIKKIDALLVKSGMGVDPMSPEFHKAFGTYLTQMKGTVQKMKTTWPKTRATVEALELAEKYGLAIK